MIKKEQKLLNNIEWKNVLIKKINIKHENTWNVIKKNNARNTSEVWVCEQSAERVLILKIVGVIYYRKTPLFLIFWKKLRILGEILPDDFEFLSDWSQIAGNLWSFDNLSGIQIEVFSSTDNSKKILKKRVKNSSTKQ